MTTAVAPKVSEDENDQLLRRGLGIQRLGATALDHLLSRIEVVVAFARQTDECIGLLGVTLEDITLDSPGNADPSAGCDEEREAALVVADEPLHGDIGMTGAGSPRYEASDWMAGLGFCVGEQLMTRPPGYSLQPLPSFHDSFA